MKLNSRERQKLRQLLANKFVLDELKTLAFDLGVDYDTLKHDNRNLFALGLVQYFEHREQLNFLIEEIIRQRKNIKEIRWLNQLLKKVGLPMNILLGDNSLSKPAPRHPALQVPVSERVQTILELTHHPFYSTQAEHLSKSIVQELYIDDRTRDTKLCGPESIVVFAPKGGGKTMLFKYCYFKSASPKANTLVVQYNKILEAWPASLETHTVNLLHALGSAFLELITTDSTFAKRFTCLSLTQQKWWWNFFNQFPPNTYNQQQFMRINEYANLYLQHSQSTSNKNFIKSNLSNAIQTVLDCLRDIDIHKTIILVDAFDGDDIDMVTTFTTPLFADLGLYNIDGLFWKYFLPSSTYDYYKNSEVFTTTRLNMLTIEWTEEALLKLLLNRLKWFSTTQGEDITFKSVSAVSLEIDIDRELVKLALTYQDEIGAPRALLRLARYLIDYLPETGVLISKKEWLTFESQIDKCFKT